PDKATVGLRISFFFQAEDGIRDFHVTGVQTCALPICTVDDAMAGSSLRTVEPCRTRGELSVCRPVSGGQERTCCDGVGTQCLATNRISHPRSAMNCRPLRPTPAAAVDGPAR